MTYGTPGMQGGRHLQQVGSTAFAHDAAGRMVAAGNLRMTYDGFDQLLQVRRLPGAEPQADASASDAEDTGPASVRHTYGYDGARAYSEGPDGTSRYFFADLVEHNGTRQLQFSAEDRPRATAEILPDGSQTRWRYHHSGLAPGASVLTDAGGDVVERRLFEPFGAPITADFADHRRSAANKPRDPLTGWADHGARWQAPQFASWLSVDRPSLAPSAEAVAIFWDRHPYQVNRQNPNLFHDPDGNVATLVPAAVGVAAGAVGGGIAHAGFSLYRGELPSLRGMGAAVAGGAINGGITGLTCGANLLVQAGGVATGALVGGTFSRAITGDPMTASSVALDLGVAAVSFGLAKGTSNLIGSMPKIPMPMPTQAHQIFSILDNAKPRQTLMERFISTSREFGRGGRMTKGAQSIAKKHGHGPSPGEVSAFITFEPKQKNAEFLIGNILNNPTSIRITPKNADIYSGNRGLRIDAKDFSFTTFMDKR